MHFQDGNLALSVNARKHKANDCLHGEAFLLSVAYKDNTHAL